MQVLRAVISGADVVFGEYRDLATPAFSTSLIEGRFISLVPTQLARLLPSSTAVSHLRTAAAVFVGGGAFRSQTGDLCFYMWFQAGKLLGVIGVHAHLIF